MFLFFIFLLIVLNRCADKLHYKRQKEKEQSEKRERAENKRKRCQFKPRAFFCARAYLLLIKIPFTYQSISRNWSRSIDETDNDCEGSKDRRKGLNIPLVILHFLHDETFLCLYSVLICIYDFILCVKIFQSVVGSWIAMELIGVPNPIFKICCLGVHQFHGINEMMYR